VLLVYADAPKITMQDLTISGGIGTTNNGGGAVHDGGNIMNFVDVTFSHNKSSVEPFVGGAVDDDGGAMTVTRSTFVDNTVAAGTFGGGAIAE